jgi:multidrug efflux pump
MNISRFFIDRPIFAAVLSLLIFLGGFIALWHLPVSEYPEVVPPSVVVTARYPGANPRVIAETVATPLEEQINGVENMLYMFSQGTSDGQMSLTITFKIGTDPDLAQQLVQNRVNQALPRLPDIVRQFGVTTVKSSSDITMVVHILSPDQRYDNLYLGNYATLNIKDRLSRLNGVGQVIMWGGSDFAMRVWLDPEKIAARGIAASEVIAAIREQNVQVAAGVIGTSPSPKGTDLQLNINTQGRLQSEEEFGDIIIKTAPDGAVTRLKDVARIELGASQYALRSLLDNKPAVAIGIFQAPGSNTIQVSDNVRAAMEQLKASFPKGMDYSIVYDPTTFVRDSIEAVVHTLLEAITLVVIVVILFLQTWRASIIPLLAVPVSIIGTFALMLAFGFSINALTLFGLVLAIGIVVDDAIVVVENVERNIESGLSPRDATYQAMREVSGPIVAIGLSLIAVFVPLAFISGLTGQFYRQFALTIAISTVISAFNSLTLSPAMAAILLKSHDAPPDLLTRFMEKYLHWIFGPFNRLFSSGSGAYARRLGGVLRRKAVAIAVYLTLIACTAALFMHVPVGYIPAQDKQYLIGFAQLPDGASLDRTEDIIRRMSEITLKTEGVEHAVAFPGLSINGFTNSSSAGIVFVTLQPFSKRHGAALSAAAISQNLNMQFGAIKDAFVMMLPPPPILGLGTTGGFKLQIEDRADLGDETLFKVVQAVQGKAWQTPGLAGVFSGYQINVPQLQVDIDRTRAKQLGIAITDIFDTMQVYLGSLYINDFNKFGRTYQVIAQADAPFRDNADDIARLKVKNHDGEMVPLGSVLKVTQGYGPERAMRYNAYRTADINGGAAPGYSSGQAQNIITNILKEILPPGMTFEWTDLTYQQILAGDTSMYVFPLCVLLVFLVLAAQYESLTLPLAVILIVPMCLLCAIFGVWVSGGDNNIFTQIGFIVLVGLACKNAILIVEFARELELEGKPPLEAAIEAARLRLRPILMTSFAFIMGVVPLVLSSGAGAEMRHAMGVAVFSGMLGVTFFGLFLTPVFYVLLRKCFRGQLHSAAAPALHAEHKEEPPAAPGT